MSGAQDIVRYYSGKGPDDRGRYLAEVQEWTDDSLEGTHDFIQWMFPLRERSGANPDAPTLDNSTVAQFRTTPALRANLRLSLARMLKFYGFEIQYAPQIKVALGANFQERARTWMFPGNHNYLRITRILKSLSLLGLEEDARNFFDCLSRIYQAQDPRNPRISSETFNYWKTAIQ